MINSCWHGQTWGREAGETDNYSLRPQNIYEGDRERRRQGKGKGEIFRRLSSEQRIRLFEMWDVRLNNSCIMTTIEVENFLKLYFWSCLGIIFTDLALKCDRHWHSKGRLTGNWFYLYFTRIFFGYFFKYIQTFLSTSHIVNDRNWRVVFGVF